MPQVPVNDLIRGIRSVVKEMLGGHVIFIDEEKVLKGQGKNKGKFVIIFGTTAGFSLQIEIDVKEALKNDDYFTAMIPDLNKSINQHLQGLSR